MNVLQRIEELQSGDTIWCDLHLTLMLHHTGTEVNEKLINALINARQRGIKVVLWTGGNKQQTIYGLKLMEQHRLQFDDVYYNINKPNLLIDNISVNPNYNK